MEKICRHETKWSLLKIWRKKEKREESSKTSQKRAMDKIYTERERKFRIKSKIMQWNDKTMEKQKRILHVKYEWYRRTWRRGIGGRRKIHRKQEQQQEIALITTQEMSNGIVKMNSTRGTEFGNIAHKKHQKII